MSPYDFGAEEPEFYGDDPWAELDDLDVDLRDDTDPSSLARDIENRIRPTTTVSDVMVGIFQTGLDVDMRGVLVDHLLAVEWLIAERSGADPSVKVRLTAEVVERRGASGVASVLIRRLNDLLGLALVGAVR